MQKYALGNRKYEQSRLLKSSAGRNWSSIAVDLRAHAASETAPFTSLRTELAIPIRGCSGLVVREGNGVQQETLVKPDEIWITPAGFAEDFLLITDSEEEVLHLYLPQRTFDSLESDEMQRASPYTLRYLAGIRDDMIVQTARALMMELAAETSTGRMLAEALALGLAARLAHSYAEPAPSKQQIFGSHQLDTTRLRRVLEYVGDNLDQDITVAQLAGVACLSPFHFARMFRAAMGISPQRHVSQRRLEKAKRLLAYSRCPLSDIALSCQFSTQASFNRAFRRATGMTPGEYRRERIEERYLRLVDEKNPNNAA